MKSQSEFVYHSSHSKVKVSDSTNFGNHTFNSRTAVVIANWGERGNGLRSKTHEPVLFERSAFACECAEQLTENRELSTAARRCRGLGAQPIKRQAHIGFAQQNCLHLKILDFRSMAQKDLLLSDACLPFCGHSLLFFCRRFLFQIKRKCRNAGSIHPLIRVRSEGRS